MNRDRYETRYLINLRLNLHICQRANRKEMVKRCFSFQPQCVKVKSYVSLLSEESMLAAEMSTNQNVF